MNPLMLRLIALSLFGGFCWLKGANHVQDKWTAANAAAKVAVMTRTIHDAQVSQDVTVKYVDRVRVIHAQGQTIIKEVPNYVTTKNDAACVVNTGFVRLHNAAADGADLPASAGIIDATPSGIALSTVAETVADNYRTCRENGEQLTRLQEWVASVSAHPVNTH